MEQYAMRKEKERKMVKAPQYFIYPSMDKCKIIIKSSYAVEVNSIWLSIQTEMTLPQIDVNDHKYGK